MKILIASSKQWFNACEKTREFLELDAVWVSNPENLNNVLSEGLVPEIIFFPHWNWIVSKDIYTKFRCVVFHVAPLPYGRGGSPIQNLILRGITEAPVNALMMGEELDAGDILLQEMISLEGKLSEIFLRIGNVVQNQIVQISKGNYTARPQIGVPTYFRRLSNMDNQILTDCVSLSSIYDRIRMVDAPEYPKAFCAVESFRLEFSDAILREDGLTAKVRITKAESNQ